VKFTDANESSDSEETNGLRRLSQDETSVKQLEDKHRTASQLTLRSQVDQIQITDAQKQELEQDDSISKIPKAILKNTDQKRSSINVSPSSDTDSGIDHRLLKGDRKDSLKDKSKPPTPPPMPRQVLPQITQKLHLKNEDVAQKKSVFTIAYNEVKSNRLNSADSSTIYI